MTHRSCGQTTWIDFRTMVQQCVNSAPMTFTCRSCGLLASIHPSGHSMHSLT